MNTCAWEVKCEGHFQIPCALLCQRHLAWDSPQCKISAQQLQLHLLHGVHPFRPNYTQACWILQWHPLLQNLLWHWSTGSEHWVSCSLVFHWLMFTCSTFFDNLQFLFNAQLSLCAHSTKLVSMAQFSAWQLHCCCQGYSLCPDVSDKEKMTFWGFLCPDWHPHGVLQNPQWDCLLLSAFWMTITAMAASLAAIHHCHGLIHFLQWHSILGSTTGKLCHFSWVSLSMEQKDEGHVAESLWLSDVDATFPSRFQITQYQLSRANLLLMYLHSWEMASF